MTPQYMIEIKRKKRRKFRKLVKNIKSSTSQITTTTELGSSTINADQSTSAKQGTEQPRIQDNGNLSDRNTIDFLIILPPTYHTLGST